MGRIAAHGLSGPQVLSPPCALSTLTVAADVLLEVADLVQRRVLAAGAEQIAEAVESDAAVASLVEQGEGLLVVGRCLGVVLVRSHGFVCISGLRDVCDVGEEADIEIARGEMMNGIDRWLKTAEAEKRGLWLGNR